ncbi:MAG TPA: 50S ribosomal protein L11 [Candidatus Aenigmarchaeota archaeon]|nr:MAG: 50S ribosomal protein L11 [Candidatus Aenigmarchaeota archaeon]HDD46090.1 50S ribosomal protein L11 [Candidatus Aenigmarchaeota archaeon]
MGKEKVEVMVEGGKATAAPPLGPALGPLGVDINKVVNEINARTKDMAGMKVPVKVIVDTATKEFEIEVGTPPVSALIKKELGIDKGSGLAGKVRVGDLTMEQVRKIAKIKFGSDDESYVRQVIGSARSAGITVEAGPLTEEEKKEIEKMRKSLEETKSESNKQG